MQSTSLIISGFLAAAIAAMALVLWASQSQANDDGLVIAVFAPTTSERSIMHAVVEAGGTFVRASLPDTIIVAHSNTPGLADRLKAQGAWLTYGQAPFGRELGGCLVLASAPYDPAIVR